MSTVPNISGGTSANALVTAQKKKGAVVTLGASLVLGVNDAPLQIIDPTAARNVDLPAEADSENLIFHIVNISNVGSAAESITLRNDAAGTIVVIASGAVASANEFAIVHCDGITWRVISHGVYATV